MAKNDAGEKVKLSPEEKAAKKEKRAEKMAALSPEERQAKEAKRAERRATKED